MGALAVINECSTDARDTRKIGSSKQSHKMHKDSAMRGFHRSNILQRNSYKVGK